MASKVIWPMEMADGILVRNLPELQEHFNSEKVAGYYISGKLMQWLESRYYDEEAEAVAELDDNAPDFMQQLAAIFGVTVEAEAEIDFSAIQKRNTRIAELRQAIDDPDVIKNVDLLRVSPRDS